MPATLWVGPANDDKLLSFQAFRFQPCAAVGLVAVVDSLRNDAFEAVLAGGTMERWAVAYLVVVVPKRSRCAL